MHFFPLSQSPLKQGAQLGYCSGIIAFPLLIVVPTNTYYYVSYFIMIVVYKSLNRVVPIDLMMFIRTKKKDRRIYYYIVKSVREGDKVQQKVLCYLGTAETFFKKLKLLKEKP